MPRAADPAVAAALVEAAARLLATEGPAALTTRRLAREVGSSTMAVYTHFGGMDELVRAVVRVAFDHLAAELDRVPATDDPIADLAQLGLAYRRNALAEPHLYLAMFGPHPDLPYQPTDDDRLHGLRTFTTLVDAVRRCLDATPATSGRPPASTDPADPAGAGGAADAADAAEAIAGPAGAADPGNPANPAGPANPADPTGPAEAIAGQIWAAAHGAVSLELAGFLDDDGATFAATTLAVLAGVGILAGPRSPRIDVPRP